MYKNKDLGNTAILGWADLTKGTAEGGGYNLVAQDHALKMQSQGNKVYYLQSGFHYDISNIFGKKAKARIDKNSHHSDINCFVLFNSSNRAPALQNLNRLDKHDSDSTQNQLVIDWLFENDIKQVYIHSLEGQSLSLLKDIKMKTEMKLYIICHDHFYICPRVNLLYQDIDLCLNYHDGVKCSSCINQEFSKHYEKTQAIEQSDNFLFKGLLKLALRLKKTRENIGVTALSHNRTFRQPYLANEIFLDSLQPVNRRKEAIKYLNYADVVYAPSSFIIESLIKCGLIREKTKRFCIQLPHLDELKAKSKIINHNSTKLRFSYRGSSVHQKGLTVFLKAILNLDTDIREKCQFLVRGPKYPSQFQNYVDQIPELTIHSSYKPEDLKSFVDEYDIGVLPHIWFENSPITLLEHLASGKPVLTSRLGGVTDFIEEGKNGWFFSAGDPDDLSLKITQIVEQEKG